MFALLAACFAALIHGAPGDLGGSGSAIHFTLKRRGGPFAGNRTADLDYLMEQVQIAESRFNSTQREVQGNRVVRAPKSKDLGGGESIKLMDEIGKLGNWYRLRRYSSCFNTDSFRTGSRP